MCLSLCNRDEMYVFNRAFCMVEEWNLSQKVTYGLLNNKLLGT